MHYLTKQKPFLHHGLDIVSNEMARKFRIKPEEHHDKKALTHVKMNLVILVVKKLKF